MHTIRLVYHIELASLDPFFDNHLMVCQIFVFKAAVLPPQPLCFSNIIVVGEVATHGNYSTYMLHSYLNLCMLELDLVDNFIVAVENEAPLLLPPNPKTNLQRDEVKPLSGKPYCHMILSKSSLSPRYELRMSISLRLKLPSIAVPTVLTRGGKSWDMVYNGQSNCLNFTTTDWKKFAEDNSLKVGDACIFELMECSKTKVIIEVQILRGDIPSEILDSDGQSAETAIVIN
ncbi:hypothetical protein VNO77_04584 [Canavalia gladiata]|uniref:TF-B3 domain-containing protein n=1 Tax=Canavalia gladiata TaxID=3824 RepID=A0AAN9MWR9_CANGL